MTYVVIVHAVGLVPIIGSRLIFVASYKTDSQKVQRTEIVVFSNRCYGARHLVNGELSTCYKY